ncbi:MAG: FxsA family protein [Oligoflexus sp.]
MFLRLLLAMTIVPILELFLIIRVHYYVSANWGNTQALLFTFGTIFVTGIVGAKLAKVQGFLLLFQARQNLARGIIPSLTMLEGILLVIGAALLLTPGYLSDVVGFILLVPMTRSRIAKKLGPRLAAQVKANVKFGRVHMGQGNPFSSDSSFRQGEGFSASYHPRHRSQGDEEVIDVEAIDEKERRLDTKETQ